MQQGNQSDYETAAAVAARCIWDTDGSGDGRATTADTLAQYDVAVLADAPIASSPPTALATVPATADLVSVRNCNLTEGHLRGVSISGGSINVEYFGSAATVDSLQADITGPTTTVIGSLNTGIIGVEGRVDGAIAISFLTLSNMATESIAQTGGSRVNSAAYFEPADTPLAQIARNAASVLDESVIINLVTANIATAEITVIGSFNTAPTHRFDAISTAETTLIGSFNTGDIASSITQNASSLTTVVIGN